MISTRHIQLQDVEAMVRDALTLQDASLVIFRRGMLAEFKTEMLQPGLSVALEGRYRSWQLGPFEGHHCHLDLQQVKTVWFDAEPVSCQGGRLNFTVWFLGESDCGNPYRPDGLFSFTLNAPYTPDGLTRVDLIEQVYALHERHSEVSQVTASPAFLAARPTVRAAFPSAD
ncbi:hypothetical protein [Variovorax sp. J31P207]|uniref:hypothetical protein n=1 Tax=Variovorax sp. J31P207 TaxID=3053510 RepID=UPI0025759FEC|nr:hypothetical protein [Variovorax sp. J31P207]MDM0071544.1 hypothetical protein [Variovorax sp. J31P207]